MYRRQITGWIKHIDFILIDIFCLQLCFVLVYFLFRGFSNPYRIPQYRFQAILFLASQIGAILVSRSYEGLFARNKFEELVEVTRFTAWILFFALTYMFFTHISIIASRLQVGFTCVLYVIADTSFHILYKKWILKNNVDRRRKKSMILITSSDLVEGAIQKLYAPGLIRDFVISRIILLDEGEEASLAGYQIPVTHYGKDTIRMLSHEWIDEAFILQPDQIQLPEWLMDDLLSMGIVVNYTMSTIADSKWPNADYRSLGEYKVLTNSLRITESGKYAIKRMMDIIGGIVGCVLTGILIVILGPLIYRASPGPIIFSQERIGRNGKVFKMHKFRSMYLDAEQRKAELMDQNTMNSGLMFKLDDDPRIIGSEKKDKNGKPRGIGNFIRNTSLDEFPQFYDVLIGNMSLVGTRPPTVDEWNQYNLSHRIRMSTKPGITGLWQISGRSEITDFEDVVRLDREYIENWSLVEDIRILLKTVSIVVTGKGAK